MLTIGSLFSGIGGLEGGLEMAGLGPVRWQCEINPFARAVLAKHWPDVERFEDVTEEREWPHVDLVCGGFPCTDTSPAGSGAGLHGKHSGLWWPFARVVDRVRPRYVVIENVAGGARRWLPQVRRTLFLLGYESTALAISAADVGAPHLRRRIFVVAHTLGDDVRLEPERRPSRRSRELLGQGQAESRDDGSPGLVADGDGDRRAQLGEPQPRRKRGASGRVADRRSNLGGLVDAPVVDAVDAGRGEQRGPIAGREELATAELASGRAPEPRLGQLPHGLPRGLDRRWPAGAGEAQHGWEPPRVVQALPKVPGGVRPFPNRGARLKALGNAVVPQCAEVVGRVILAMEKERHP